MSHIQRMHDATGIVLEEPGNGILQLVAGAGRTYTAVPADGTAGFAENCICYDELLPPGFFYVNCGTNTSCLFRQSGPDAPNTANTNVATVGAATLTAAAILGGLITRTGVQVAAWTDTTDTAANIIAATLNQSVGSSFLLRIVNPSAYADTLSGGTGVTLSGAGIVAPYSTLELLVTIASATTVTMYGIGEKPYPGSLTGAQKTITQQLELGPAAAETYASAVTIDVTKSFHVIAASNTTSAASTFTPSAAGTAGDVLEILTEADSSGTCTVTFASTFHSSGTQATTASHFSSIAFRSDGTRWLELSRTTNLA